ncbi:hypothetical protein Tco_0859765 [Tanacetum coccineum]|uniref:Uncharacterized protein n=1 Tax=Tanacetum coccineum TaxID=301880 RepID=A0ABQ5BGT8_9ASTR
MNNTNCCLAAVTQTLSAVTLRRLLIPTTSFRNFHELDDELLVKLQDYWWKNGKACNNSNVQEKEEQRNDRQCDAAHNASVCKIRRFKMIKYSFGQDEEYVVVKECEYDDLANTNEDACRAYQEIFRSIDEGWVVTRAE